MRETEREREREREREKERRREGESNTQLRETTRPALEIIKMTSITSAE